MRRRVYRSLRARDSGSRSIPFCSDQRAGRAHRTPIAVNQLPRAYTPLLRCFGPDRELPYRKCSRTNPGWNHSRGSLRLEQGCWLHSIRAPPTMNAQGTLCSELERQVEEILHLPREVDAPWSVSISPPKCLAVGSTAPMSQCRVRHKSVLEDLPFPDREFTAVPMLGRLTIHSFTRREFGVAPAENFLCA